MLTCEECGHEQEEGENCATCGGSLKSAEEVAASEEPEQSAADESSADESNAEEGTNEFVEQAKESTLNYFNFIVDSLKDPKAFFQKEKAEYINGIITLSLFALFYGFTNYIMQYKLSRGISLFGLGGPKVSFFKTFFGGFFGIIVAIAVIVGALFLVLKLFSKERSFEEVFASYCAHLTVPLGLLIIAFLLSLVGLLSMAGSLFGLSSALVIGLVPLYIVARNLTLESKSIDAFYGYLAYVVVIGVVGYSIFKIALSAMFGGLSPF